MRRQFGVVGAKGRVSDVFGEQKTHRTGGVRDAPLVHFPCQALAFDHFDLLDRCKMKRVGSKGKVIGHNEEKVHKIQVSQSKRLAKARVTPVDNSQTETYDYIIVGAGTAGCVLAHQLTVGTKNRVLVVENGPPDAHANDRITVPFLESSVRTL